MTQLSDATATRRELIEHLDVALAGGSIGHTGSDALAPVSAELADSLIDHDWVLGRPGSIPESQTLEIGPTGDGGARMTWPAPPSARTITFNLDTGDVVDGAGRAATGPIWDRIAAYGLAGVTPEMVAKWHGDWLEADGQVTGPEAATRVQQVDDLLAGVEVFDAEVAGMVERLLGRVQLTTPLANRLVKAIDNATPGAWEFAGKALAPDATARVVTEIVLERDSHASRGYTLEHDDQHGSAHLLHEAKSHLTHLGETPTDQHVRGEMIVAASLLVAAVETIDRGTTPTVPQPVPPYDGSAGRIPYPGEPRRM